jgi:hypothetical protein
MSIYARCVAIILITSSATVYSAQSEKPNTTSQGDPPPLDQGMNMSQVIALLQQQQKDLAETRKLLTAQAQQISSMKDELDVLRTPTPLVVEQAVASTKSPTEVDTKTGAGTEAGITIAEITTPDDLKTTGELKAEAGEAVAEAQADDPTKALLSDFVGAWRLPGTDAALRIGGYVKTDVVYNFDALEIPDRFIVGAIPVGDATESSLEAQSSITASQSRLNFDLREPTDVGILRAFIEGDFAGDDDSFRLRHAFGQWNRVLAGKTWSAFMDTDASPEEVDFEGLNGRINVRQAQVRLMPTRGAEYGLELSLEDPNPQVQNGQGVTRTPDLVVVGRFDPKARLHMKLGLIGRQIRAQANPGFGSGVSKAYAWGATVSGRLITPRLDERDNLMFQLNGGNGIGRYVNDLSSIGSFDGILDPVDGDIHLFDVLAGYVSWQHWWGGPRNLRSNYTLGYVNVDNPGFVGGDAYKRTVRLSTNLFWTPTPRIDVGAEYLWGKRENEDGENGDATQIQLMARYRF